jgi:hypothetical protein
VNIAAIHDLQEANGSRFLVMELVEGETLADRIGRGPVLIDEALEIAKQICEALEVAHEKGIVHRDLKPANIKVRQDTVKVLDFGLAKALDRLSVASVDMMDSPTLRPTDLLRGDPANGHRPDDTRARWNSPGDSAPAIQVRRAERHHLADGHWLAYEANASGRFEIYERPYPDVNRSLSLVSTNGGTKPIWARSGQELFYVSPTGALMRVGVSRGSSWSATKPSVVVKERYFTNPVWWGRSYDVSPDGSRFLMIKEGGPGGVAPPASLVVVQHWFEELKRLVPTN